MANILSNFEGWGPTEVAYKKSVFRYIVIVVYFSPLYHAYYDM